MPLPKRESLPLPKRESLPWQRREDVSRPKRQNLLEQLGESHQPRESRERKPAGRRDDKCMLFTVSGDTEIVESADLHTLSSNAPSRRLHHLGCVSLAVGLRPPETLIQASE